MSFFGNSNNSGPTQLDVAKIEAEVLTEMFNKMAESCFKKCVVAQHDNELNVGEMACTDRCISKYMQAQDQVGAVLRKFEEQVKAQEAAGLKNYQFKPTP